ncbi:uncharacterized protein LOC119999862 [Tripterygium wilfordii]|uniref:uncharacterized protein LOC119999862 n=1 Tax=Tripterygium wilfordii TaxID=458696 RepID=UPI0018F850EF|nr:uncharacterized protein LOC119999862 [Tripterygium wilfordii]
MVPRLTGFPQQFNLKERNASLQKEIEFVARVQWGVNKSGPPALAFCLRYYHNAWERALSVHGAFRSWYCWYGLTEKQCKLCLTWSLHCLFKWIRQKETKSPCFLGFVTNDYEFGSTLF